MNKLFNTSTIDTKIGEELQKELRYAMRHLTLEQFSYKCRITDKTELISMYQNKLKTLPSRGLLKIISSNSGTPLIRLYELCGYSFSDPEEDSTWRTFKPERGEIYMVDFGFNTDREQNGIRPAVIIGNWANNNYSDILQVCPITSQFKTKLPVHVNLNSVDGMYKDSIIMPEQIRCVSKRRLFFNGYPQFVLKLSEQKIIELNNALELQYEVGNHSKVFDINNRYNQELCFS